MAHRSTFLRIGIGVMAMLLAGATAAREDYSGQTLTDTNFLHLDLSGANFSGARLNGVQFGQANLSGADFSGAILGAAALGPTDFTDADLSGANFAEAKLTSTISFQHADVAGANFAGMDMTKALFGPDMQLAHLSKGTAPAALNRMRMAPGPGESVLQFQGQQTPLSGAAGSGAGTSAGKAIHVSRSGTDSASCGGSTQNACQSIARGMARCKAVGTPCSVLIAYGKYGLKKSLAMINGVSLIGGYVNGKPSSYQSMVSAPAGGVPVITAGTGVTASLKNLILVGSESLQSDKASVVMQIVNTKGIGLDTVDIQAGSGHDAGVSSNGTAKAGVAGHGSTASSGPGAGGVSQCASANQGGAGAEPVTAKASCSGGTICKFTPCSYVSGRWYGLDGGAGQSTGGKGSTQPSPRKACSWDKVREPTKPGGHGGTGNSAGEQAKASGNRIGSFDRRSGVWSPQPSADGQAGRDGGGGGGGGAGIPSFTSHCPFLAPCRIDKHQAKGGGGGGSGGCGASGGQGGQMGGASFGVVLVNSDLQVGADLKIVGAQGGRGGGGGAGVAGGGGGSGGDDCGKHCNGASRSGKGGAGGPGGASGGGAGGNGGPSVGIVLIGTSKYDKGPTSIYPGASGSPGAGGAGVGKPSTPAGGSGQSGLAQATYILP